MMRVAGRFLVLVTLRHYILGSYMCARICGYRDSSVLLSPRLSSPLFMRQKR